MSIWSVDADDIKKCEDFNENLFYKTYWIEDFLDLERESKFFVIATKGFGKTYLLKAKRIYYQNFKKDISCIPENELLDRPIGDKIFSKEMLLLYNTLENWSNLWLASLLITILKHEGKTNNLTLDHSVASILNDKNLKTVTDHFVNILSFGRNSFFKLCDECEIKLAPTVRDIHTPIAIFIDNIDEYFNKHVEIVKQSRRSSDIGELSPNIWYYSQMGLIIAAYNLYRINHHIRIFASIRKEAFLKLAEDSSMIQQYRGTSIDIKYPYDDLKEIFERNIKSEKENRLAYPAQKAKNPIYSFLGVTHITNRYTYEKEDAFDYIYRHTILRPRDFMTIGGKISLELEPKQRNEDNISKIINKAASEIAQQYINEFLPHLRMNIDKLFSMITSNILAKEQIRNICSKYNKIACIDRACKKCNKTHIFCDLHKVGLLGYIAVESTTGRKIQKFLMPGEKTFAPIGILPDSSHYLIHPVLDEIIRKANNTVYESNINSTNALGYDRHWKTEKEIPPESTIRPTVFISSTKDLNDYRDAIEEIIIKKNFASIRSETFNRPNVFIECKKMAKESHYFVAILGPQYGEEIEGKSICEHEFDAAYEEDPEKIIVYVLEGEIESWNKKQQSFVQRVQNIKDLGYARGDRINLLNIKDRFEKDLVERIARLSKRQRG